MQIQPKQIILEKIIMKNIFVFILLTIFSVSAWAIEDRTFGDGAKMDKLVAISTVLATPKEYLGKEITVAGIIVSVCSKRGCWMKLASDKKFQTLRIKVKDGDMVFPFNAKGQTAYATGRLKPIELTKEKSDCLFGSPC